MSGSTLERPRKSDPTPTLIERVRNAGAALAEKGHEVGRYFQQLDSGSVATQRETKDQLPRRLKASSREPQIVTVQARGEEEGGTYLILPLEKMAETLEAQGEEEPFVPITASLREIGDGMEIPVISPRGSGRRMRPARPAITAPRMALTTDG